MRCPVHPPEILFMAFASAHRKADIVPGSAAGHISLHAKALSPGPGSPDSSARPLLTPNGPRIGTRGQVRKSVRDGPAWRAGIIHGFTTTIRSLMTSFETSVSEVTAPSILATL